MKENEKGLIEWGINTAKDLEIKFEEQGNTELADAVAYGLDLFYPGDVVKEIMQDETCFINGKEPEFTIIADEYYFLDEHSSTYNFRDCRKEDIEQLCMNLRELDFWLPNPFLYGRASFIKYQDNSEYCQKPLYFMQLTLSHKEQIDIIFQLCYWYSCTDQCSEDYTEELRLLIHMVLQESVALNPRYLLMGDVLAEMSSVLPENDRMCYTEAYRVINTGASPIPCKELEIVNNADV